MTMMFENGVLRDGARHHVRMHMRDSRAPLITDGTSDPLGLHRPGWRIASGGDERDVLLRDSQRKAIEEAHADPHDSTRRRRTVRRNCRRRRRERVMGDLVQALMLIGGHSDDVKNIVPP
jgi:hypothetical protein